MTGVNYTDGMRSAYEGPEALPRLHYLAGCYVERARSASERMLETVANSHEEDRVILGSIRGATGPMCPNRHSGQRRPAPRRDRRSALQVGLCKSRPAHRSGEDRRANPMVAETRPVRQAWRRSTSSVAASSRTTRYWCTNCCRPIPIRATNCFVSMNCGRCLHRAWSKAPLSRQTGEHCAVILAEALYNWSRAQAPGPSAASTSAPTPP